MLYKYNYYYYITSVPVFGVWLQARDKVTCPWFHSNGLVVQGDGVGGDLRPVAVRLVPLQEEAGGRGVTWLGGGREVQEGEGWDLVGSRRRGPETHLLTVRTSARLIHRLSRRHPQKNTEEVRGMREKRKGLIDRRGYGEKEEVQRGIKRRRWLKWNELAKTRVTQTNSKRGEKDMENGWRRENWQREIISNQLCKKIST